MRKLYKLNAEDIEDILAKHFKCTPGDVFLEIEQKTVGYGMGEHTENMVVATVEIPTEEEE